MEIKFLFTTDIKENENNSKKHPAEQIQKIAESIKRWGFNSPILIDKNGFIVAGHGRFKAAKKLKLKKVPTICLDHLSPTDARAYLIADNKLSETGWDTDTLAEEMFQLSVEGINALDMGFSEIEMEKLMKIAGEEQDKKLMEDLEGLPEHYSDINARVTPGQVWQLGPHTVHVAGRRLDLEHLWDIMMSETQIGVNMYLLERQAKSIILRWEQRQGKAALKPNRED